MTNAKAQITNEVQKPNEIETNDEYQSSNIK
jgi:hypothetical protein